MKQIVILLKIMLIGGILITACKKEEPVKSNTTTTTTTTTNNNNNNNNNNASGYYFKCKLKGSDWSASNPIGEDSILLGSQCFLIRDNTTTIPLNQFSIAIMPFNDTVWALQDVYYIDNNLNIYDKTNGINNLQLSVTKDSVNKIISGAFSFSITNDSNNSDTLKITNGTFKVKY